MMSEFAEKAKMPAKVLRDTDKTLLCDVGANDGKPRWIPKSQIDDDSEVWKPGQEGELIISAWFAEKEGLI